MTHIGVPGKGLRPGKILIRELPNLTRRPAARAVEDIFVPDILQLPSYYQKTISETHSRFF